MNFVSFINEFINPAIPKYHELLIEDFKKSLPYTEIVNRIFYKGNSLEEFLDWHKNMRPLGFDYIKINSKGSSIGRFCRIEELDNIQHVFRYIKEEDIKRFNFFLEDEYSSFEDAKASFPRPYYYVRENLVEILDGILFSSLSGFTRDKRQSSLFEKVLFENVSIIFDTNRNDMYYKGIESYIFPDLIFKINGKKIKINLQTDLKSLIFLSNKSFMFFYDQIAIIRKELNGVVIGDFNIDEPIIFNDPNTRTFIVTNYHETVHRSHKYIMLVLELFLHYYQIFEDWAIVFLNENYKKIINHPEF